ncbi:MAG: DUF2493 domain-containing protein [Clostridia bacterium]|nr:DUF2493 domain-containing protein [Clostridia bacterium]
MRVAVVGSRRLYGNAYEIIKANIPANTSEIISGGAVGVDALAERYAKENGIRFRAFLPDYDKNGRNAPLIRNIEIIKNAQLVLAFWDGYSRGTAFTIAKCVDMGVPVKVIRMENREGKNENGKTN